MDQHSPIVATDFLEYVAFLEDELERRKLQMDAAQSKHDDEKACLKAQKEVALDRLREAREESLSLKNVDAQTKSMVYDMKNDFFETGCLLEEELKREKVLEEKVHSLEVELEMRNNLLDHRWRRHEKARKQLEKENAILKKKATLGWMLGCLSEVYMLSEPKGAASSLLKMVRSIQRELESENVVADCINDPLHVKLEHVEREISRLIQCVKAAPHSNDSKNNQSSKNRSEEEGPCFFITVRKANHKGEGVMSKAGDMQEEKGDNVREEVDEKESKTRRQQQQEVEEKLQSTQEEIKQTLGRLEASMGQLLEGKQGPQVPSPAQEQQQEGGDPPHQASEEQQPHVQERSIDDLILSRARMPSGKKKTRKAKQAAPSAATVTNNTKPFLPAGHRLSWGRV
ncbi:hypothetical protein GOP47_0009202 [Adiantum capillus-veneris]|uniref:Uncharacterized protein n=1 Tax=Adiantum capillus-veneris TaxID=13818 RepID=A0A9D4UWB0_ADICA|nr:hypothetical protein GOP47_0009202 [Adiantum capillus-veneris]